VTPTPTPITRTRITDPVTISFRRRSGRARRAVLVAIDAVPGMSIVSGMSVSPSTAESPGDPGPIGVVALPSGGDGGKLQPIPGIRPGVGTSSDSFSTPATTFRPGSIYPDTSSFRLAATA
jgi:hypothetical protein